MKAEQYIGLSEYLMGRDETSPITDEQSDNAATLMGRVNQLLAKFYEVHPTAPRRNVSSGYRPAAINAKVGGATKSAHLTCEAVDLTDKDRLLTSWLYQNQSLLKDFDLYLENPDKTPTWAHLQSRRTKSGKRVFNP